MKTHIIALSGIVLLLLGGAPNGWCQPKVLKLSTTTSTQSSGLLDILLPAFERDTGIKIKVMAKGTGAAIRDGQDGNVDLIFVHAKSREITFVNEGFGTQRYPVMHNDFVLLGPAKDPAGIRGRKDAPSALASIAIAQTMFISRGDDSGTHTKEQALWADSGVQLTEPNQITSTHPVASDNWYTSIGQGMGKVYTLADRGTYIKYKFGKTPPIELELLSAGDPKLVNPYGIIPVNPKKHPHVQYPMAMQFVDWITGTRGQQLIEDYRLAGKQLFHPDANK